MFLKKNLSLVQFHYLVSYPFDFVAVPVGFALFFHNFSTFVGKPGIYLEDLFVLKEYRGFGYGKKLLTHLATIAKERECGRYEWVVLDWNEVCDLTQDIATYNLYHD